MLFYNDLSDIGLQSLYDCIHILYSYNEFKQFTNNNNNENYQFICYDNIEKNKKERIKVVKTDLIDLEFY